MRSVALALLLAGCGGTSAANPDGPLLCNVAFSVLPTRPLAPVTMSATASVTGGTGFINIDWTVTGPAGALTVMDLDSTGLRVSFPAEAPGPYHIGALVTRGGAPCGVQPATVNVGQVTAHLLQVRLRYVPLPGQEAPPQIDPVLVSVPGGADYDLPGERTLDLGTRVEGMISGPAGAGIAAYLRLGLGAGGAFELFADSLGRFGATVPPGVTQISVVPYGADVAPQAFAAPVLAHYVLDAGDALTGTVRDARGDPVAGARVAAGTGPLPPLVAITGADGRFATRVRVALGGLTTLTVVAPAGAPTLKLAASLTVRAGSDLEVRLPDLATAPFQGHAVDSSGAPLPGAEVTLLATSALAAGSVAVDGGAAAALTTSARIEATAGAGGALPALVLPVASWQAIVDPGDVAGERVAVVGVEAGAASADLASAAAAPTRIAVTDADGVALAGARVTAVAAGAHGVGAGRAEGAVTDASGAATVALAPGATYALLVDPPDDRRLARGHATATGGVAPAPIALAAAIAVRGAVVFPAGGGQPGVGVEALCATCGDPTPLAAAVTTAGGAFTLLLPDPGVQ